MNLASRLPKPLATLFEKLSVFSKHYPDLDMQVKVKGASVDDSESCPEVEAIYQRHQNAQVLFNPANQFRAMRKLH